MTTSEPAEKIDAPSAKSARRTAASVIMVALWCAALFACCLWLYTRNNGFPLEFHADEPGKVLQITEDSRNYRHPQLMLEATELWRLIRPTGDDPLAIAIAGRQVSAFFGAGAVAGLALTAYLCVGWWGLLAASVMLGLCPPILTYSHYMKEDASLLFGVALTVLAAQLVWIARRWWTRNLAWTFLAAGCALAASGKYVGALMIVLPAALVFVAPGFRWYRPLLWLILFVPLLLLFVGTINHRAINPNGIDLLKVAQDPEGWHTLLHPSFLTNFQWEVRHSVSSHAYITANRPNSFTIRTAITQNWPHAAIPALAIPLVLLLTRRHGWAWETMLIGLAICWAVVLSYGVLLFPRYTLPLTALVHLLGSIAIGRLLVAEGVRPAMRWAMGGLFVLIALINLAPTCLDINWQFGHDSRLALREWAKTSLPQGARVLADSYAGLSPEVLGRPDLRMSGHAILPRMEGFEEHTRSGEEMYIVICEISYDRYFDPSARAIRRRQKDYDRDKGFYARMLTNHTPIWSHEPKRPIHAYTNPAIYVYRLGAGEQP